MFCFPHLPCIILLEVISSSPHRSFQVFQSRTGAPTLQESCAFYDCVRKDARKLRPEVAARLGGPGGSKECPGNDKKRQKVLLNRTKFWTTIYISKSKSTFLSRIYAAYFVSSQSQIVPQMLISISLGRAHQFFFADTPSNPSPFFPGILAMIQNPGSSGCSYPNSYAK